MIYLYAPAKINVHTFHVVVLFDNKT